MRLSQGRPPDIGAKDTLSQRTIAFRSNVGGDKDEFPRYVVVLAHMTEVALRPLPYKVTAARLSCAKPFCKLTRSLPSPSRFVFRKPRADHGQPNISTATT
jgi:hypothetical protein